MQGFGCVRPLLVLRFCKAARQGPCSPCRMLPSPPRARFNRISLACCKYPALTDTYINPYLHACARTQHTQARVCTHCTHNTHTHTQVGINWKRRMRCNCTFPGVSLSPPRMHTLPLSFGLPSPLLWSTLPLSLGLGGHERRPGGKAWCSSMSACPSGHTRTRGAGTHVAYTRAPRTDSSDPGPAHDTHVTHRASIASSTHAKGPSPRGMTARRRAAGRKRGGLSSRGE